MLVDRIYKYYEGQTDKTRSHLGASEIGHECDRRLWLSFRWATSHKFEGRVLRLFETGTLAEQRFIDNLKAIGIIIKSIDEQTGLQHQVSAYSKHFGGSIDAIAYNVEEDNPDKPYIVEFKTHNDKSFAKLVKEGCDASKPEHYAQMQIYMGLSGIHQAIYLAVNKNTEELYEEVVLFNPDRFEALMNKAKRIISSNIIPPKIHDNPAYYKCKTCPMAKICQGMPPTKLELNQNCRTCKHSEPSSDGLWKCLKTGSLLNEEQQLSGCNEYLGIDL